MDRLRDLGIDYDDVIQTLEKEGVDKFVKSWNELVDTVQTHLEGGAK
jgi:transaldolase